MKKKNLGITAIVIAVIIFILAIFVLFFPDKNLFGDTAKGVVKDPQPPLMKCASAKIIEIGCRKFPHLFDPRKKYALNPKHLCLCAGQKIKISHEESIDSLTGMHLHGTIIEAEGKSSCE
jgi:hypothetical protein